MFYVSNQSTKIYIDVREPSEYASGHVEGAINLPVNSISEDSVELKNIKANDTIIVYCRSGVRAGQAQARLQSLGYHYVTNGINQESIEKQLNIK